MRSSTQHQHQHQHRGTGTSTSTTTTSFHSLCAWEQDDGTGNPLLYSTHLIRERGVTIVQNGRSQIVCVLIHCRTL